MSKIEMMEVNQHTSDEVAKVLADLEAQGVDITAIKEALASGGSSVIKSIQRGTANCKSSLTVNISQIDPSKSFVLVNTYHVSKSNTTPAWSGDGIQCTKVNATSLEFVGLSSGGDFTWQVIEFV